MTHALLLQRHRYGTVLLHPMMFFISFYGCNPSLTSYHSLAIANKCTYKVRLNTPKLGLLKVWLGIS
jgi:hypothetical protein